MSDSPFILGESALAEAALMQQPDEVLSSGRIVKYDKPLIVPLPPGDSAPATPTGLHQTQTTVNSISVAWNANTEPDLAGYRVYWLHGWTSGAKDVGLATGYTIPNLPANTDFYIAVAAYDTAGNPSAVSPSIRSVTAMGAPGKPVIAVPNPSDESVFLNWDDVAGATSYVLQRLVAAAWQNQGGALAVSQVTITGLTASTKYTYRVIARNGAGNGPPSDPCVFTTDASTPTPPSGRLIVVPVGTFNDDGTRDVTDDIVDYFNNVNVGTLGAQVRVVLPKRRANGALAQFRIDGGHFGGGRFAFCNWITFDGGGTPGQKGMDGALFMQSNGTHRWRTDPNTVLTAAVNGVNLTGTQTISVQSTSATSVDFPAAGRIFIGTDKNCLEVTYNGKDGTHLRNCKTVAGSGIKAIGSRVTTKRLPPFEVRPSTTNIANPPNPNGDWDVWWTPRYGDSREAKVNVAPFANVGIANARMDDLNLNKAMWRPQACTGLMFARCHFRGNYEGGMFDNMFYGNDCHDWQRCTNVSVIDSTVHNFYGQTFQMQQIDRLDDRATIGVWYYRCDLKRCGRQIFNPLFGGNLIVEECFIGDSQLSLFDTEPISHMIDTRAPFNFTTTVQNVFILKCNIGTHASGGWAAHPGISRVRISGNRGLMIGVSGTSYAEKVVIHDNESHTGDVPHNAYVFGRAEDEDNLPGGAGNRTDRDFGGRDILIRDNNILSGGPPVLLRAASGGRVVNYQVLRNVGVNANGVRMTPNWLDSTPASSRWPNAPGDSPWNGAWLNGVDENGRPTLAIPSHPHRDLIVP